MSRVQLTWEVLSKRTTEPRTATIDNCKVICAVRFDGYSHYVAYINTGKSPKFNKVITFSPARYVKIERTYGDIVSKVEEFLSRDRRNRLVSVDEFRGLLKKEVQSYDLLKDIQELLKKEKVND